MIEGLFPDEPADGDDPAGWLDLPEYPDLDTDDVLTPDLDHALDTILASAHIPPLPDDTLHRFLHITFTSPPVDDVRDGHGGGGGAHDGQDDPLIDPFTTREHDVDLSDPYDDDR